MADPSRHLLIFTIYLRPGHEEKLFVSREVTALNKGKKKIKNVMFGIGCIIFNFLQIIFFLTLEPKQNQYNICLMNFCSD